MFINENKCGLTLNLHKPVPHQLTELGFIQPIISAYNPYLTYFIKELLELLEPQLPPLNIEKICSLAKLISKPQSNPNNKVYTVKDLQSAYIDCPHSPNNESRDSDIEIIEDNKSTDETSVDNTEESEGVCSIWSKASIMHNWSVCPIGLLPWQQDFTQAMET